MQPTVMTLQKELGYIFLKYPGNWPYKVILAIFWAGVACDISIQQVSTLQC